MDKSRDKFNFFRKEIPESKPPIKLLAGYFLILMALLLSVPNIYTLGKIVSPMTYAVSVIFMIRTYKELKIASRHQSSLMSTMTCALWSVIFLLAPTCCEVGVE